MLYKLDNSMPTPDHIDAQIVVIGSGPGGATTAHILAEAGLDVLIIESGPYLKLSSCQSFSLEEMRQKYRNAGQTIAFGKPRVQYVEGQCVGGGSEINSALYHRTPDSIVERWQQEYGVIDIAPHDLSPHFEVIEHDLSISTATSTLPRASVILEEGSNKLGWLSMEVPRWQINDGDESPGIRNSMTRTYIPRALKNGARLLSNSTISSLRKQGSKWRLTGVCSDDGNRTNITVNADVVVLACGAIHTPFLLRSNGILRNVGNQLQLHPTIKLVAYFDEEVNADNIGVPVHQVKEFSPEMSFGCSISTLPYLALSMIDHPGHGIDLAARWKNMAIYYAMIMPEGRGSIRKIPGFKSPFVRFNLTQKDRSRLRLAISRLAHLLHGAGASALYPSITGGPVLTPNNVDHELPEHLPTNSTNIMTIHLFSSCPMGENKKRCATDSFGAVYGHDNLFISDASLLPTAPAVNPQGTIMAIARRNALHFLAEHKI
ncbi:FAD-dependent oxidoreductase [Candidatus Neomarinimicrobiota bacterium]